MSTTPTPPDPQQAPKGKEEGGEAVEIRKSALRSCEERKNQNASEVGTATPMKHSPAMNEADLSIDVQVEDTRHVHGSSQQRPLGQLSTSGSGNERLFVTWCIDARVPIVNLREDTHAALTHTHRSVPTKPSSDKTDLGETHFQTATLRCAAAVFIDTRERSTMHFSIARAILQKYVSFPRAPAVQTPIRAHCTQ